MKPYENLVTLEAMLIGYTEAINRFDAAAIKNDPVGSYTALVEALNWAVALGDRTDAHVVLDGKPVKYRWRERIPNAEVMGGVRYVRNSVLHQWSDAVVLSPGATLPRKLPFLLSALARKFADVFVIRRPREDPRAVLPRLDRVLRQPSPDRHPGDLFTDPPSDSLAREL